MKILIDGDPNRPVGVDVSTGTIDVPQAGRLYINFRGTRQPSTEIIRHSGELVLREGVVALEYDKDGFLCGLEVICGDPFTMANTDKMEYLQPKNPLKQPNKSE